MKRKYDFDALALQYGFGAKEIEKEGEVLPAVLPLVVYRCGAFGVYAYDP